MAALQEPISMHSAGPAARARPATVRVDDKVRILIRGSIIQSPQSSESEGRSWGRGHVCLSLSLSRSLSLFSLYTYAYVQIPINKYV